MANINSDQSEALSGPINIGDPCYTASNSGYLFICSIYANICSIYALFMTYKIPSLLEY